MLAGNEDFVMAVHKYAIRAEAIDRKIAFRIFSRMIERQRGMIGGSSRYSTLIFGLVHGRMRECLNFFYSFVRASPSVES